MSTEWNGEGLPTVGVECEAVFIEHEHKGYGVFLILGYHSGYVWMEYTGELSNKSKHYTSKVELVKFRKLETSQQREDRERLEAAIELHDLAQDTYFANDGGSDGSARWEKAPERVRAMYLAIVDKTKYRKGV